ARAWEWFRGGGACSAISDGRRRSKELRASEGPFAGSIEEAQQRSPATAAKTQQQSHLPVKGDYVQAGNLQWQDSIRRVNSLKMHSRCIYDSESFAKAPPIPGGLRSAQGLRSRGYPIFA